MRYNKKGQAFLALVLLIGGIVVTAGIALAFIAISSVNTSYGFQNSESAEALATAGAEDALLQLDRNPSLSNTTGYTITLPAGTATVTITQNSPSSGQIYILSSAAVSNQTRKIGVVVSETATGQTSVVSWGDVP